jgi:hypothetical protein
VVPDGPTTPGPSLTKEGNHSIFMVSGCPSADGPERLPPKRAKPFVGAPLVGALFEYVGLRRRGG